MEILQWLLHMLFCLTVAGYAMVALFLIAGAFLGSSRYRHNSTR